MEQPRFELSKQTILQQYNTLSEVSDIVSYSSKTNPQITPILEESTDSMFSIHLPGELKNVSDCSRVLFLAQGLSPQLIQDLFTKGVRWFVVDNVTDLDVLVAELPHLSQQVNVLLRVKLKEYTLRTEKYYVFGMPAQVVTQKIHELRKHEKIAKLGIHYHKKTQNMAEWNLQYELEQLFDQDVLDAIDVLNIGGGFPSEYKNTNSKVLPSILEKVRAFKSYLGEKQISLIVEPGRFIAAPAGRLVAHITAIHENTLILDVSVYNTDMDALIVPVKLLVEGELENGSKEQAYVIKGMTPCSLDLFRYKVYLDNPKQGDTIVFKNAGAYNFTTDFCDLEKLENGDYTVKILQIPFSGGGLGKGNGAHEAPAKVCSALEQQFTNEQGQTPTFEIENITLDETDIGESHAKIEEAVSALEGKAILLGGDHSITAPAVKGFAKNNSDFWFIVFDAHPDLMDDFDPPTQEDYLRVLIEQGIVDAQKTILVGLRNWDKEEVRYLEEKQIRHYTAAQIFEKGIKTVMSEILEILDGNVYLSLDIDVVDPVEAIGTGYIEHGGLSSRELIYAIQELKKTGKIAMCDLVEINPSKDVRDMTAILGAKLLIELGEF